VAEGKAWGSVYLGTFRLGKADATLKGGFEVRLPVRMPIGGNRALSPGFAVALFEEGDGKDLGGPVEFRSSLELSHRRSERSEIGITLYHLSKAGIYDENPGSNSLVVSYTFRPGHR
jgi:hypothetical protein